MKMFSKAGDSTDARKTGTKRDVTIVNEPKKRPDHVMVETEECSWKLPLTLEEQFALGRMYEKGTDDEEQMLSTFVESVYQAAAAPLTVEIKPWRPGEAFLQVTCGHRTKAATVSYVDLGQTICQWTKDFQHRRELVADLVAAFPDEEEQR